MACKASLDGSLLLIGKFIFLETKLCDCFSFEQMQKGTRSCETLPKAVPFSVVPKGQFCSQARPFVLVSQGFTVPGELCGTLHPRSHMVPTKWSLGTAVPQLLELWPQAPDALLTAVINSHSFWLQNVLDLSPVPFLKASLALLSSHL